MARPKKTLKDLPKNWKKLILGLAAQGASDVEIRVALGCISDDLWYRFIKEKNEFSRTIQKAHLYCEAWWLLQARENLKSTRFNTALWMINMKNRFGWKDARQQELTGKDGGPIEVKVVHFNKKK